MLKCEDTAVEVAQESYLRMLSYSNQTEISNPQAYLFQVAANLARTHLKKKQKQFKCSSDTGMLENVECPAQDTERLAIAISLSAKVVRLSNYLVLILPKS